MAASSDPNPDPLGGEWGLDLGGFLGGVFGGGIFGGGGGPAPGGNIGGVDGLSGPGGYTGEADLRVVSGKDGTKTDSWGNPLSPYYSMGDKAKDDKTNTTDTKTDGSSTTPLTISQILSGNADAFKSSYGSALTGMGRQAQERGFNFAFNQLQDWNKGLKLHHIWDDPLTSDWNENRALRMEDQISSLSKVLDFYKTKATEAKDTSALDMISDRAADLKKIGANIDAMEATRLKREKAIRDAVQGSRTGAFDLLRQLKGMDITDTSKLSGINDSIADYRRDIRDVRSPIFNQLFGLSKGDDLLDNDRIEAIFDNLAKAQAKAGGIQSDYDMETKRISDFEDRLLKAAHNRDAIVDGLDITDPGKVQRQIDFLRGLYKEADTFTSKLPHDFKDELAKLNSVYKDAQGIMTARESELDRIDKARGTFSEAYAALESDIGKADIYNGNILDALQAKYDKGLRDMQNFDSKLSTNFSGVDTGTAKALLDDLYARRGNALSGFDPTITAHGDVIANTSLWEEPERQAIRSKLAGLRSQIGSYSGSDAQALLDRIATIENNILDLSGDYTIKKGDITEELDALENTFRDKDFYTADDIQAARDRLDAFETDMRRYGISRTGAYDNIDDLLSKELTRIQTDADNVASWNTSGGGKVWMGDTPMGQFLTPGQLTDDQIRVLLGQMGINRNSSTTGLTSPSSFSAQLTAAT